MSDDGVFAENEIATDVLAASHGRRCQRYSDRSPSQTVCLGEVASILDGRRMLLGLGTCCLGERNNAKFRRPRPHVRAGDRDNPCRCFQFENSHDAGKKAM